MSNPTILIVEDEAIISKDIANKLRRLGYAVAGETDTGENAIEIARRLRPSLVLMDIRLAGAMDGVIAADTIWKECRLPVVFMTAHSDNATVQRAGQVQAFGYIMKPFEDRELHVQIKMALSKHAAELRLIESESRLREVLENSLDASYKRNLQTNSFDYLSPAFARISGYTPDKINALSIETMNALIHPDDQAEFERVISGSMSGAEGSAYRMEFRFRHKNGHYIWLLNQFTIMRDANGKPSASIGIVRDITERKQAEHELLMKARTLECFFESAPYIMMLVNEQGRVTEINRSGVRFTGRSKDELLGLLGGEVFGCLNSFDGQGCGKNVVCEFCPVRSRVMQTFETGEPIYEERGRFEVIADGVNNMLDILVSTTLVRTDRRLVLVTIENITNSVRTEDALRENEEKYRTVFENMVQGSFYQRNDGVLIDCNLALLELFGLTRNQFLGRTSMNLNLKVIHEDGTDFPGEKHPSMEALRTGKPVHDVTAGIFNPRKQCYVWLNINAIPLFREGEDQAYMVFVTLHDITERKKAEEEKIRLESRLLQSQKMESIGSLAGGIAHDLNNILFPISGLSEMLLDELPPDNPEYESIEQIHKSAQRGSDLVKQILAFSRQSNPQKLPIRIQLILKEVLKLVRATIPMNIEITTLIDADCGMVSADPTQLHQVAMNLITNAFHAVEDNGGIIHVGLKEKAFNKDDYQDHYTKSGRYACITISDTGTGIDQTNIDKIFDPYFTTKEQGKGTGLGLSVVHGIIKEHGGDISFHSEVGEGTSFNVYLPLLEAKNGKNAPVARKPPTGCEKILLVDDEEPILRMEQMMLEKLGYQTTIRLSSPEALAAFEANPDNFDLVISDRGMPKMTGEQLARELISIRPEIPIILCTGFSDENDERRAKDLGVKGYLKKPVARGDLAEMVRKVLDEVKGSTQK